MTKFRKSLALAISAAALLTGTGMAGAQGKGQPDLFAFSEGARIVEYPDDVMISQMDSSPLNLIDGFVATDWTGQASPSPVFVLELPERTELSRISFDTGPLNRDAKAVRSVTVSPRWCRPRTSITSSGRPGGTARGRCAARAARSGSGRAPGARRCSG